MSRSAIVTGSAVRIGRAVAQHLADRDYAVLCHYAHSGEAAETLVAEIRKQGGNAARFQADLEVATSETANRLVEAADELGPVELLVNNAAIFEPGTLASTDQDSFQRHLAINLQAPWLLAQAFARTARSGQIIQMVDWRALRPPTGHLAYTVSKAGLVALTQMMAQELAPSIRVNAIAPGAILPPADAAGSEEEYARRNLLQRIGGTEAIVRAVDYLLNAEFVTGDILTVTGGEQL